MTAVIIILAIVLLVLLFLFLPFNLSFSYNNEFSFCVKISGITVYKPKEKKKTTKKAKNSVNKDKTKEKNIFEKLKEKLGFIGALKEIFHFLKKTISNTKKYIKRLKFKKTELSIIIATDDAAKTAVDYGVACSIVYPCLSLLESCVNIKYKKIDVKSDFEGKESNFTFCVDLKLNVYLLLAIILSVYKDYKNLLARLDTNE